MGLSPITIQDHAEIRRQAFLDDAARYRMVKQVQGDALRASRFPSIRTTARRLHTALTVISVRLHANPAALELSNR